MRINITFVALALVTAGTVAIGVGLRAPGVTQVRPEPTRLPEFDRQLLCELPFRVSDLGVVGEGSERAIFVAGRQQWAALGPRGEVSLTNR